MAAEKVISELNELATVDQNADWVPVVDVSDTSASEFGTTKKALVEQFIGPQGEAATIAAGTTTTSAPGTDASVVNSGSTSAAVFDFTIPRGATGATGAQGNPGADGANAYCYIAYASDASGAGFTTTFNANLDYIAILSTDTEITNPQASDFAGLWKNYKGATGDTGAAGADAYVYIAYASDINGSDFTMTFDTNLDFIAILNTTTAIPSPSVTDFAGLWKNYKGLTGEKGDQGNQGDPGFAATITVGTTTTLDAGSPATVENVGDSTDAIFNFGIPKGADGTNGTNGTDGLDINWLGAYDNSTNYVINDAVSYGGSSYICKLASTGNIPTNTTYWDVMAVKGTDGEGSGDVIGPATNTDSYIPQWDGANSKTLKNGLAVPAGGLAGITALNAKPSSSFVIAMSVAL